MSEPERPVSYRQAVEAVLDLLNGQWVVAVLAALGAGPLRFTQLQAEVNAVEDLVGRLTHEVALSRRSLSRTVLRMAADGLILRHDVSVSHPEVWYELTPTGLSLLSALHPLAKWGQKNGPFTENGRPSTVLDAGC